MTSRKLLSLLGLIGSGVLLSAASAPLAFADDTFRADQSHYQFVCDGTARPMGNLNGAVAGELITFSSPDVAGLLSGNADDLGDLPLSWQCGSEDIGTTWHVTAIGQTSGLTTTFEVEGIDPDPTVQPVVTTVDKPSGDIAFPVIPADAEAPRPAIGPRTTTPPASYGKYKDLIASCGTTRQWNCYEMGKRYLEATGEDEWINEGDLIWAERPLWSLYEYWLRDNVAKALNEAQSYPADEAALVPFSTGWQGYNATGDLNDWHNALGHFSVQLAGDVWVGPVDSDGSRPVQVRYRTFMFDVYNFDGQGELGQFRELATQGWAAEFSVYGAGSTITFDSRTDSVDPQSLTLQW